MDKLTSSELKAASAFTHEFFAALDAAPAIDATAIRTIVDELERPRTGGETLRIGK